MPAAGVRRAAGAAAPRPARGRKAKSQRNLYVTSGEGLSYVRPACAECGEPYFQGRRFARLRAQFSISLDVQSRRDGSARPPAAANTSHMPQSRSCAAVALTVVLVRVRPRGRGVDATRCRCYNRYGTVTATGDGNPPGAPASRVPGAASAPAPAPAPARVWRREGEAV